MTSPDIRNLLSRVHDQYGGQHVRPYGTNTQEEHGTAFTIDGVPATFSIHTHGGELPSGTYDIQIESLPPGYNIYTAIVGLERFMDIVTQIAGPLDGWPV